MRKFLSFTMTVLFMLSLSSCDKSRKNVTPVPLTPSRVMKTSLGMPTSMQCRDGVLVIVDFQGTGGLVSLWNAETGKTLGYMSPKGNGTDELVEAPIAEVTTIQGMNVINLYDLVKKRLLTYNFQDAVNGKKTMPTIVKMKSDGRYYGVNRLEGGYAAMGLFENNKFELLDDSLKVIGSYGTYLQPVKANKNKMVNAQANYGRSMVSPDKTLLVNISFAAGVVRFYDIKGNRLTHKKDAVVKPLNYSVKGNDYHNLEGLGFLALAISDKYVYALYSGEKENFSTPMPTGKQVYKYDYNGDLQAVYTLNAPTFTLAVSEDDKSLYTLTDHSGYSISAYSLP